LQPADAASESSVKGERARLELDLVEARLFHADERAEARVRMSQSVGFARDKGKAPIARMSEAGLRR
jgi:hypothetical protein